MLNSKLPAFLRVDPTCYCEVSVQNGKLRIPAFSVPLKLLVGWCLWDAGDSGKLSGPTIINLEISKAQCKSRSRPKRTLNQGYPNLMFNCCLERIINWAFIQRKNQNLTMNWKNWSKLGNFFLWFCKWGISPKCFITVGCIPNFSYINTIIKYVYDLGYELSQLPWLS